MQSFTGFSLEVSGARSRLGHESNASSAGVDGSGNITRLFLSGACPQDYHLVRDAGGDCTVRRCSGAYPSRIVVVGEGPTATRSP
jgi:hypothetical protein